MGELILPLHFVCVSFVFLFCFFKRLRRKLTEPGLCVRGLLCGFKIFLEELLHWNFIWEKREREGKEKKALNWKERSDFMSKRKKDKLDSLYLSICPLSLCVSVSVCLSLSASLCLCLCLSLSLSLPPPSLPHSVLKSSYCVPQCSIVASLLHHENKMVCVCACVCMCVCVCVCVCVCWGECRQLLVVVFSGD